MTKPIPVRTGLEVIRRYEESLRSLGLNLTSTHRILLREALYGVGRQGFEPIEEKDLKIFAEEAGFNSSLASRVYNTLRRLSRSRGLGDRIPHKLACEFCESGYRPQGARYGRESKLFLEDYLATLDRRAQGLEYPIEEVPGS